MKNITINCGKSSPVIDPLKKFLYMTHVTVKIPSVNQILHLFNQKFLLEASENIFPNVIHLLFSLSSQNRIKALSGTVTKEFLSEKSRGKSDEGKAPLEHTGSITSRKRDDDKLIVSRTVPTDSEKSPWLLSSEKEREEEEGGFPVGQ